MATDYFFETSSKTNKNVNEVFDFLAHKLLILKLLEGEKKKKKIKKKKNQKVIYQDFLVN